MSRFVLDTSVSLAWFSIGPCHAEPFKSGIVSSRNLAPLFPRSGLSRWRTALPLRSAEAPSRGLTSIGV